MAINTGWSYRGRPFSKSQFENSYLKKNKVVKNYSEYLSFIAKNYKKIL